jgi:hypothetical protein
MSRKNIVCAPCDLKTLGGPDECEGQGQIANTLFAMWEIFDLILVVIEQCYTKVPHLNIIHRLGWKVLYCGKQIIRMFSSVPDLSSLNSSNTP